jgi:outer membrane protein OmpA-like peptidoglycan-associated protein
LYVLLAIQFVSNLKNMRGRQLPILLFILWSLICWRWYVCGIKQQCATAAAGVESRQPAIERVAPDSAELAAQQAAERAAQNAIQPVSTPGTGTSTNNNAAGTGNAKVQQNLTNDIESAQIVAVADRVQIHFPYGSNRRVDDDAIDAYLSDLANALTNSNGSVTLIGHTDGIGDAPANKTLALQRAQHIKNILIKKGVAAAQVKIASRGESKPIASNDNPQGRYRNRRVEVILGK